MTDKETLQELIGLMYECRDWLYGLDRFKQYNKEDIIEEMEDYEIKDMASLLEKYPYLNYIPYGVLYAWQQYYNSEVLCAGWCECTTPEHLIEIIKKHKEYYK